jgi:hypothetical protein
MSKHVAPDAALSPKVAVPGLIGLGLTVVSVILAGVTPDMLEAIGPWAVPVAAGLVAGGGYLAGYLKRDPLREVGGAAVQAGETPTGLPHPDAVPSDDRDPLITEADALAARAAELRREGA